MTVKFEPLIPIKYRQPVFNEAGKFGYFHYWGWISEGNFVAPLSMAHNVNGVRGEQFIGICERKSGKEIYIGDILEFDSTLMVVMHDVGKGCYYYYQRGWDETHVPSPDCIILGNIHTHKIGRYDLEVLP